MTRIGILGGTFDPIHEGHIKLAKSAKEQYGLCRVHFLTGGIPPHKRNKEITDSDIRHEMVKLATKDFEDFVADDFELSKKEYTYSVGIIAEIKALHPDWDIYFIIGEDSLRDLHLWHKPEEFVKLCKLLVYPRENDNLKALVKSRRDEYNAQIDIINADCIEVSSTALRKMIAEGKDVSGLIPERVIEYIKEKGLYRNGN